MKVSSKKSSKSLFDNLNRNYGKTADEIGYLKAQIDELSKKKKHLQKYLIDEGVTECEGIMFRVTVSHFSKFTTNWKRIAEKLNYSRQMKAGNTSESEVTRVNVKAKLNPTG